MPVQWKEIVEVDPEKEADLTEIASSYHPQSHLSVFDALTSVTSL